MPFFCSQNLLHTQFYTMRSLHLFFAILLSCFPVAAQEISVDFTKNPDKPVAIENPATGKTLFFFYPQNLKSESFAKEGNPCKAFEIDTKTLKMLRSSPDLKLSIPTGDNQDVRVLCRFSRGDDYFMALENSGQIQVLRISGQDLTMQKTETYTAGKKERIVNGVTDGKNAYILCSVDEKKEGKQFFVFRIDADGLLEKHVFPAGEKPDRAISAMFLRFFKPLSVEYGLEQEPETAASPTKLFADDDKLWVTIDNSFVGPDNSESQASVLKVVLFDLATDSLHLKVINYGDVHIFNAPREARNSYIFDKKIFQLYMNSEQILLRVRDLYSGEPIFTKTLLAEDTIEGLANSPILVPGRGGFGIEKEYRSVQKFIKRFSKYDPFIQVRRSGDDYLMCIGGHEVIKNYNMSNMNPTTGMMTTPGYMASYERAFSFYSAINAQTMTRSPVFFKKSLVEAYSDMLEAVERPRDQALYRIGEQFYLGFFDKAEKKYRLRHLKVQTR